MKLLILVCMILVTTAVSFGIDENKKEVKDLYTIPVLEKPNLTFEYAVAISEKSPLKIIQEKSETNVTVTYTDMAGGDWPIQYIFDKDTFADIGTRDYMTMIAQMYARAVHSAFETAQQSFFQSYKINEPSEDGEDEGDVSYFIRKNYDLVARSLCSVDCIVQMEDIGKIDKSSDRQYKRVTGKLIMNVTYKVVFSEAVTGIKVDSLTIKTISKPMTWSIDFTSKERNELFTADTILSAYSSYKEIKNTYGDMKKILNGNISMDSALDMTSKLGSLFSSSKAFRAIPKSDSRLLAFRNACDDAYSELKLKFNKKVKTSEFAIYTEAVAEIRNSPISKK